ncbi:hypothetical protein EJ04DRAFT_513836 [Polyplosphaeria fusca]|uniref:Uncharacterized protein n=1 Tax=Polyplosphaeria fusca TaxID=682080 RepID=A0A9P4V0V5_9PLEO|nr:hypothetical protein EJ04DRAFT_513836 [Polyplosphaeria fusca]
MGSAKSMGELEGPAGAPNKKAPKRAPTSSFFCVKDFWYRIPPTVFNKASPAFSVCETSQQL